MANMLYFKEKADFAMSVLVALYVMILIANLAMGYRYIDVCGIVQSGGIFIFPFSFIISDIISEIYGSRYANFLLGLGLSCLVIFALYAFIVVRLPAPLFLADKEKFFDVFNPYMLFAWSSVISIGIGTSINTAVLGKMSAYLNGEYFVLRSFVSSTIGELFVTVVSMLIANWSRMEFSTLAYMATCCFLVKMTISFLAIWPASVIIYFINNEGHAKSFFCRKALLNPIATLKKLAELAWHTRGYAYCLEAIDLDKENVHLAYRARRGVVILGLSEVVLKRDIMANISPENALEIGFYYGRLGCEFGKGLKAPRVTKRSTKKVEGFYLKKGYLNILSITRDGQLNFLSTKDNTRFSKHPADIYRDKSLIDNLDATQAAYIGCLAGMYHNRHKEKPILRKLELVKG